MTKRQKQVQKPSLPEGPQEGAPLAAWVYLAEDLVENGLSAEREASEAEMNAVAKALGVVSCRQLSARYAIHPLAGGRFRLEGDVSAHVTQTCGITLEPVEEEVAEPFALEFWPAGDMPTEAKETDLDPFAEEAPEAIEAGLLQVGRIAYEYLAQGIDPFPRKAGAELEIQQSGDGDPEPSPFAVLAKLKPNAEPTNGKAAKPGSKRTK